MYLSVELEEIELSIVPEKIDTSDELQKNGLENFKARLILNKVGDEIYYCSNCNKLF